MIRQCPECGYRMRLVLVRDPAKGTFDVEMWVCLECGNEQEDEGEENAL